MFFLKKRGKPIPLPCSSGKLCGFLMFVWLIIHVQSLKAADLYWIGGPGKWSDIRHWSLSSGNTGGLLSPSIPLSTDNVIFDHLSGFGLPGSIVTIDQESYCRDIRIKGLQQSFTLSGTTLKIYGNADFQAGIVLDNTLYMNGNTAQALNFNEGVTGNLSLLFTGAGSCTVQGKLNSTGKIYFLSGSLDFGSSSITTGFFGEEGCCGSVPFAALKTRSLNLGSSRITLAGRNNQSREQSPSWMYTGSVLQSGTSTITLAKSVADGYGVSFIGANGHHYSQVIFSSTGQTSDPSPYKSYQIAAGDCSFKTLAFANDGFIASNCSIDTLRLSKSGKYSLFGKQSFHVIENNTEICDAPWSLTGYGGLQTGIRLTQPLSLHNVKLGFLKVSGNILTAYNGRDEGTNEGIVFQSSGRKLYWIGGGGNWNDPQHWTTMTDGTPSGGCMPSRLDDVCFNSFSGLITENNPVMITSEDAECRSMVWNEVPGNPCLKSLKQSSGLSIYGSMILQKGMKYLIGQTTYAGLSHETLTTNGVIINGHTRFVSSGHWKLNDSFTASGDLIFLNGDLDVSQQSLWVNNFGFNGAGTGPRHLDISHSIIELAGNWSYMGFGGPSISLNAEKSTVTLSGKQPVFFYDASLQYDHLISNNPVGTATVSCPFYSGPQECHFQEITFFGNGNLNPGGYPTPISISALMLSPGKKYLLGSQTQTGIDSMGMAAQGCAVSFLSSDQPGTQAKLQLGRPQTLSHFTVKDIQASQPLTVTDGFDGGNNQNVRIIAAIARNLYWVGGSGKWSDLSHWSTDSNGNTSQASCLPASIDRVHFNAYSGKDYAVELDIPATCGDMLWEEVTGSRPGISGNSEKSLSIGGALTLQRGMNFNVERVEFNGSGEKLITTNGVVMGYAQSNRPEKGVFFNNAKGIWKLTDSLNVKNIGLISGMVHTEGQSIKAENWVNAWTGGQKMAKLILGSSRVSIEGYWDASGIDTLDAGSSMISMNATLPLTNESGNGLYTNYFKSAPRHVYHQVSFTRPSVIAKILCYNLLKGYGFEKITFSGEASVDASNHFKILTTAGTLHLAPGSTQQIDEWNIASDCQQWDLDNNCMSGGEGCKNTQKAELTSNFPLSLTNVRMSGIEITGPADHAAFGADMGNNSGWTFLPPKGRILYWIGGNGKYADPGHWTTHSDGSSSANTCAPTRNDRVVFNRLSGKSPEISIESLAECQDMNWVEVPGKPVFNGLINCYGSLRLQQSLIHNGGINFLSPEAEIIETRGAVVARNYDVNFSGGGKYLLMDDFTTDSHINLTKGELNTNSYTVTALSFNGIENSSNEKQLSLILGKSQVYLSYQNAGWQYSGKLDAGQSVIHLAGNASIFKTADQAQYHTLIFDGHPQIIHHLQGSFICDSLVFAPTNSTYILESGKKITVNQQLSMTGTPCATLTVTVSDPNIQAELCVLGSKPVFNYVSLSNIDAGCNPLTFLPQSANLGNNSHMVFQSSNGQGIGQLGPDRTVCASAFPIVLSGGNFLPNAQTAFTWIDLLTGTELGHESDVSIVGPGHYGVVVKYGNDCEVYDDIQFFADSAATILKKVRITQPGCSAAVGKVELPLYKNFSYSIDSGPFGHLTFYQLPPGKHVIIAKSDDNCFADTAFSILPQSSPPIASITYPLTETFANDVITVSLHGTAGGYFSADPEGLSIDPQTGQIDLSLSQPGKVYTIQYTVGTGDCKTSAMTLLKVSNRPTVFQYSLLDYCAIGKTVPMITGIRNGIYSAAPMGLSLNPYTGEVDLSQSEEGMYEVTYTYKDGANTYSIKSSIRVNALPELSIRTNGTVPLVKGQSLTLTAMGGQGYSWIGPDVNVQSATITVRPLVSTTYTVLTTNTNGCSASASYTVVVREPFKPVPNNVITPNGDGKNDYWIIDHLSDYPGSEVRILDRAGRMLYYKKDYQNDWDGRVNGQLLGEDAYIYVIHLGNGLGLLKGTISIIRDSNLIQY